MIGVGSVGNPFAKDHRRPKGKLVTDQTARDAILKQSEISFSSCSAFKKNKKLTVNPVNVCVCYV